MIENLTGRLRSCDTLPSLPGVALRIVDLASQPTCDTAQICDCISMDPALSVKFLRVTCSPLSQERRRTTSIRQAVSRMGTPASLITALSFNLETMPPDSPARHHPMRETFWRRALLTAMAAHALGEKQRFKKRDDLFLAGLLQSIGILAFGTMLPDKYRKIPHEKLTCDALLHAERKAFGAGHDEIGYWLLMQWGLPDHLALSCLANQHLVDEPTPLSKMMACVTVSGLMADCLLSPDDLRLKHHAGEAAQTHLYLNAEAFSDVLAAVSTRMPEVEKLIAPRLLNTAEIRAILNEARELQIRFGASTPNATVLPSMPS